MENCAFGFVGETQMEIPARFRTLNTTIKLVIHL